MQTASPEGPSSLLLLLLLLRLLPHPLPTLSSSSSPCGDLEAGVALPNQGKGTSRGKLLGRRHREELTPTILKVPSQLARTYLVVFSLARMDRTHGTNNRKFYLFTFMARTSEGMWIPRAFLLGSLQDLCPACFYRTSNDRNA